MELFFFGGEDGGKVPNYFIRRIGTHERTKVDDLVQLIEKEAVLSTHHTLVTRKVTPVVMGSQPKA